MKIFVNLTYLDNERITGVESYGIHLTKELIKQGREKSFILLFSKSYDVEKYFPEITTEKTTYIKTNFNSRVLNDVFCGYFIRANPGDVVFSPFSPFFKFFPSCMRGKLFQTIHDASLWANAKQQPKLALVYYRILFSLSVSFAYRVVTVSNFSSQELRKVFSGLKEKLLVVPNGVSKELISFATSNQKALEEDSYSSHDDYLVTIGSIVNQKNQIFLAKALSRYNALYQAGYKLLIVGRVGWDDAADKLREFPNVVLMGQVQSDLELYTLLRNSKCYVSASLYEGFGIPVIESISLGVHALCSDIPAHREILNGNEDYLFQVGSVDAFVDKLNKIITKDLEMPNVSKYTWERSAKRLLDNMSEL